jgi:hypothetical protein
MIVTAPARAGGRLFALAENGVALTLDLEVLVRERCALLAEVWRTTPIVIDGGRLAARPPPPGHACLRPD